MLFIMNTPRKGAFRNWHLTDIFDCIQISTINGSLVLAIDNGSIIGVALAKADFSTKTLYISQFIARNKLAIEQFINYFKRNYSGFTIQGQRRGIVKTYTNLTRVFSLLRKV